MSRWLARLAAWFERPANPPRPGEMTADEREDLDRVEERSVEWCRRVIKGEESWQIEPPTKDDLKERVRCHNYIWHVRGPRR